MKSVNINFFIQNNRNTLKCESGVLFKWGCTSNLYNLWINHSDSTVAPGMTIIWKGNFSIY